MKMRRVILYIAMSLDGYIADKNGGVGWLEGDGSDSEHPGSYSEFYETIDTVVMGYKTYHQIITELSPDDWVYAGKKSYVVTHKKCESSNEICFTDQTFPELIAELKRETGKDIWICGGAGIVNQLVEDDLIDRYCITVIPTLLGEGVPLFTPHEKELRLKLVSTCSYNGMVDIIYERRTV